MATETTQPASTWRTRLRFYGRAVSYFRPDMPRIVAMLGMIGFSSLLGLLQPWPLAILVDMVLKGDAPHTWVQKLFFHLLPDTRLGQILGLAIIALSLRVLQEILSMVRTLVSIQIGYHGLMRIRCDLFQKLQQLSIGYHRSQPQGDAIYRLSYDTYGVQTILNVAVTVLVNGVLLGVMLWIMLDMNWQLTLISLSVIPPLIWVLRWYGRVLKEKSVDARQVDSQLTTAIQRAMSSISLVQAFGREADEYDKFQSLARDSVKTWLKLHWHEVVYWLLIGLIFGTGGAIIFGYGGYLVYRDQAGGQGLSVGSLMVFLSYLGMLYDPLNKLSSTGASVQGGIVGCERVFEVLDRDPVIHDAPNAAAIPLMPRKLEFRDVVFAYRESQPVLQGLSFAIAPGEMVAFVGSSGVGKTTLLNLLPRFYDPDAGSILLDDKDIRTLKLRDLRKHIALVLQDNPILPTTIAENIAYGRPSATRAQVRAAAELAQAHEFITKIEGGYDSVVSEQGTSLSGGQRQRLAIARALLTEAPILVFDEPTSALDPLHEQQITQVLSSLKRKRTVVIVSHRLSTVSDCDRVFVMKDGAIVEQGSPTDLIAQKGLYYQMARHQLKID